MKFPRFLNRTSKVCALVAVTLTLPVLAYAQQNNQGNNNQGGNQNGQGTIRPVPEANAGWVLIPFFGAVLLFSWRRFSRAKAGS
jgi:hypothetical protein